MNRDAILFGLSSAISIAALVIALAAWNASSSRSPSTEIPQIRAAMETAEESAAGLRARLEEAERHLSEVSQRVEQLRLASTTQADGSPSGADGDLPPEAVAKFVARVEELETKFDEIQQHVDESRQDSESAPAAVALLADLQATALDRELSANARLESLRQLRFRPGGRSHDVTLSMIELIQDPELDSRLRADIIRQMDGVDFDELKQPLLDLLRNDTHAETRSEAIETLQVFYEDAVVYEEIARIRDSETEDLRVRTEAQERLRRFDSARGQLSGDR